MTTIAARTTRIASEQGVFRVVATNPPYGAVCQRYVRRLPSTLRNRVRVSTYGGWQEVDWGGIKQGQPRRTLLVSRLADIPEDFASVGLGDSKRTHLVFVEDMPVEAISTRVPRLNVRNSHRLHIARERNRGAISAIIGRAISGMAGGHDRRPIVDAWIEESNLVVLAPGFERLHVPLAELQRHLGSEPESLAAFEVDEDGSYLYWPHADVHLGWTQLQSIVDPAMALAAQQRTQTFNRKYGAAIRALRVERGLTQGQIPGVADRHLRRVEHGQAAASSSVLRALAEAHAMSLADYLAELAKRL
jgi:hypothetical protein